MGVRYLRLRWKDHVNEKQNIWSKDDVKSGWFEYINRYNCFKPKVIKCIASTDSSVDTCFSEF